MLLDLITRVIFLIWLINSWNKTISFSGIILSQLIINLKLFQKIIPLKLKSRLLDNRIINFSSATEKLYIPPYRANTLLLICIVCVVFWSNVIVFSDLLWGVGFVALGMVIYVMLVYMCLCIKYRQAQNLLNIGWR